MLPLYTHGKVEGVKEPILLKIATLEDIAQQGWSIESAALWIPDDLGKLPPPSVFHLPWGACMTRGEVSRPGQWQGAWLHRLKDKDVVAPGDVIALRPGSSLIHVLYRRGANSNALFVTEQCNNLCLMCSQPPRNLDDSWRMQELFTLVNLIDKDEPWLGITGGEPTLLGHHLMDLIRHCQDVLPHTGLHILSNGRAFCNRDFATQVGAIGHPKMVWAIPLYADNADLHDYIVQAQGAFDETVKGLYALATVDQALEIRVVLHRQTIPRLNQLAYYIFRNFPFVAHVALMGLEPMGLARKNRDVLWIDPVEYTAILEEATYFLSNRGIPVSVYNLPLCILPKSLWSFARQSISDWKNLFLDTCHDCAARSMCSGFFASTGPTWRSRAIRPLHQDEIGDGLPSAS
jgi:His-Xaa-Ser system radical SAM maturase HxsC